MDKARRRKLAQDVLSGCANGPAATTRATAQALARVGDARTAVLVEGISDQSRPDLCLTSASASQSVLRSQF